MLVKPGAYMNRSGPVVAAMTCKLGISPADLLVILDDADLPVGRLRIRAGGSGGRSVRGAQEIADAFGSAGNRRSVRRVGKH